MMIMTKNVECHGILIVIIVTFRFRSLIFFEWEKDKKISSCSSYIRDDTDGPDYLFTNDNRMVI